MNLALTRGRLYLATGMIDSAQTQFTRASIAKRSPTLTLGIYLAKADADLLLGDAAAATEDARTALAQATALQSDIPWSSQTGLASLMLGRAAKKLDNNAQARSALRDAVNHLSNTVDATHPALIQARELLAQ